MRSGRAPQGARGLKYEFADDPSPFSGSRPARGAWVEIFFGFGTFGNFIGRAPQGARGLKYRVTILSLE